MCICIVYTYKDHSTNNKNYKKVPGIKISTVGSLLVTSDTCTTACLPYVYTYVHVLLVIKKPEVETYDTGIINFFNIAVRIPLLDFNGAEK